MRMRPSLLLRLSLKLFFSRLSLKLFFSLMCAALAAASVQAATQVEVMKLAKQAAGAVAPARIELERLANEGDALAAHFLGLLHLNGKGLPQNETLAVEWFRKSAEGGRADSAHNLGVIYERSRGELKNTQEARRWYRVAADKGYASSQANLGHLLADGLGGPADLDAARELIEKSAAQGAPRGRYLLGMLTLEGRAGIQRNPGEAGRLIALAAEAGDEDAQYRLALLHGTGQGVEKSDKLALEWLRKAAAKRQRDAQFLLAAVYTRGLYGVLRNAKLAAEWLRSAALGGHVEAQYQLGVAYAEGRGVPRDGTEAYGWMLEASRNGHPKAIEFVRQVQISRPQPTPPAQLPDAAEDKKQ